MKWDISLGLLAFLALGIAVFPARADLDHSEYRYVISRNGDRIGTHHVSFDRAGDRMTVQHDLSIRVTVLSLEAYRYDLRARETWSGDRLVGFHSSTYKNGDSLQVFARAGSSGIRIRGHEGGRATAPGAAIPADPHWNVLTRPRTHMIEAEDGSVRRVEVSGPHRAAIRVRGERTVANRYDVTGDHEASLWYNEDGFLVKKRLTASDGSTVITVLQ